MLSEKYQQCRLEKAVSEDITRQCICYLPFNPNFKVGTIIRFKEDRNSKWNVGWKIVSIGQPIILFEGIGQPIQPIDDIIYYDQW